MHTVCTAAELTPAQRDVLAAAAANKGNLTIATALEARGRAVCAGRKKLFNPDDPDYARGCCDAVAELKDLQLLRAEGQRDSYTLTNFGWQQSRELTRRGDEDSPATPGGDTAVTTPCVEAPVSDPENDNATMALPQERDTPPPAPQPPREPESVTAKLDALSAAISDSLTDDSPRVASHDSGAPSLISELGLDEGFRPEQPRSIEETGLSGTAIDDLIIKVLQNQGTLAGRQIADAICLPLPILEDRYDGLRKRQLLTPSGLTALGDNLYQLTDQGREHARQAIAECAYAGPAPVPLEDYVESVNAQTIRNEKPKRAQLEEAFSDINVEPQMLAQLGPAISAGKGMFVYGPPGNGKTTVAQRITRCFGQSILVPYAIVEDGQIVKFYDASCHEAIESKTSQLLLESDADKRWVRIQRPTVVVGGELTMENLELKHDPVSHVSEASLQLKSNCGTLLIDDFGRQRINPTELLNRWIIPLENRIDFLSLANGKKIEVPFEQLIVFSTNLEPHDLADDAFLRRIPFKIEVGAPSRDEFIKLFGVFAKKCKVECPPEAIDYLLANHYDAHGRPFRRCQARDLLDQVAHFCEYNEIPKVATAETLDQAVRNYFTAMAGAE